MCGWWGQGCGAKSAVTAGGRTPSVAGRQAGAPRWPQGDPPSQAGKAQGACCSQAQWPGRTPLPSAAAAALWLVSHSRPCFLPAITLHRPLTLTMPRLQPGTCLTFQNSVAHIRAATGAWKEGAWVARAHRVRNRGLQLGVWPREGARLSSGPAQPGGPAVLHNGASSSPLA